MPAGRAAAPRLPTVQDVARAAGVSAGTVSNVLNDRRSAVSEKTRRIVLAKIEEIGFRPRSGARSLRTARSLSIALIIADDAELYLQDPFPAAIVAGFTAYLNKHGYVAVLHGCRLADLSQSIAVRQFGVDGYCLFLSGNSTERRKVLDQMLRWHQPIVLLQETDPVAIEDVCVVRQADAEGGAMLADHLLDRGARSATFVASELDWAAISARLQGFRSAVARRGGTMIVDELRCADEMFDTVIENVERYLRGSRPDALVGANDQIAIAAMRAATQSGMRVPADILITGFNALEFWRYTQPELTTIASPAFNLGARAAEIMIARLNGGHFDVRDLVLPVRFQQGGTT